MTDRERLISLLNEGGKIAGEKVHKSIHDFVKEHHHFSSKDDADKIPSRQELVADYLLDNGVIVSPVKIGGTVWNHNAYSFCVKEIKVHKDFIVFRCGNDGTDDYMIFADSDIGKTVFLTKEDAEAAFND